MALYNNIKVKAYGKINLLLDIIGRREDGYHMLNTVMQTVSVYDTLELSIDADSPEGIEIVCDKEGFPLDSSNLIWKAAELFKEYTGITFGGKLIVKVEKNLPSQAGMGGGSADCAAMLKAMNTFFCTLKDEDELCELGAKLGADVPFCIKGGTRLCQGIGEITNKLPSIDCAFVIVKPDVSVSTPEAYKRYDLMKSPPRSHLDYFLKSLASGNVFSTIIYLFNVFEAAIDQPEIAQAKQTLKEAGALNTLMTGSGSAVFGVFENEKYAEQAAAKLSGKYNYCEVCVPVKSGYELMWVNR
ncbi:4-(cytidine 5'-diphospho)-2-C-methyl-D-erythritol kinase [Ruminococcus albus]|uniref:4-diphosphocytidyl-2-C-methyl-D-erythritol kinase n=1 Tax=Ruminococcus albus (strain ATCC 27210 / DSM 20455 / JCM 14654 / NCDO 2250 / 7) TaxID=697329 RepID=E6UIX6_RUMA7|nr:4-(cytidine 5'-diphospho)-2-C-methyl-D-erythritol kinase [Ruminococcus albus]ADU22242.1 4-diphosphocytidyl-2C-methyl-D-erythritol kinase [Ruminococcus albus 7 = DSM 20455]